MPDFPKIGGATAAEVWGYGTRAITDKAGFEIAGTKNTLDDLNDLAQSEILSDATPFAGGNIANLDAAVSSRSSHAAAAIWAVATRELTGMTGTPRTDLLGEDADLEAGTGVRKARIDATPAFVTPTESSIVMDGAEKTLFEITDVKSAEVEAWVDLTPMQAGDTIVIRYSRIVKAAGAYAKYAEETYDGAQSIPLLKILGAKIYRDTKVTAQQTAGTNRTLDVQVIRAVEA